MKFDDIYREYYQKIFNYCYSKLKDYNIAEDCTQDVFLVLSEKINKINPESNIKAWLYKTAELQVKTYYRRSEKSILSIENTENSESFSESTTENQGIFDEILDDKEYKMLEDYYVVEKSVDVMSSERNISKNALYQRIRRTKQKIIENSNKFHKLLKK